MTSYYDLPEGEAKAAGIDYDLAACLEYNPQGAFVVEDIQKVLAVYEGKNDEEDWRWVLRLKDGRYVFLQGGCDYTGWDCQSWATHGFAETPEEAAAQTIDGNSLPLIDGQSPANAGLGHMIGLLAGTYMNKADEVYASLMKQITDGKDQTWREKKDDEFGL